MIQLFTNFAACGGGNFLLFPSWYHYLPSTNDPTTGLCTPSLTNITDVWLIIAAVIEILLRIAGLAAVVLVVYGGIQYTTSQGEPDKTSKARTTIINALTGLAIAVLAASAVAFIAGRFSGA